MEPSIGLEPTTCGLRNRDASDVSPAKIGADTFDVGHFVGRLAHAWSELHKAVRGRSDFAIHRALDLADEVEKLLAAHDAATAKEAEKESA